MRKRTIWLFLFIFLVGTLTGCVEQNTKENTPSPFAKGQQEELKSEEKNTDDPIELTLWSFYEGGWDGAIEDFRKLHPNIKINVKAFTYEEYEEAYLNALVTGNVPDIMTFDSNQFRNFKDINGLQDLTEEPFRADLYEKHFPKSLWQIGKSVNNKKVIGIPFSTSPLVTYYRKDIMEKYGFPSEPEALARFMEDPNNWMKIGEALKKDNIAIMQWPNEIMNIYESAISFYDDEYNFQRNIGTLNGAIKFSQEAYRAGLFRKYDINNPDGQADLRKNKFAMIYQGTYGAELLSSLVPEQAGKWRVTRLPFNVYGWNNSSILSIPTASEHKEAAWKFVEFYSFEIVKRGYTGAVPGYLPAREAEVNNTLKNEFMGGQHIQKLFIDIMSKSNEQFITPIDEQTDKIWQQHIDSGIEWSVESSQILEKVTAEINQTLNNEQRILRDNNER